MAREQQKKLIVDGGSLDLEADWAGQAGGGVFGFLTQQAPKNPWFVGIAAIVGIVVFGDPGHSPWVLGGAILSIALITVVSTSKRSDYERERTAEPGRDPENTNKDRKPAGTPGQRIAVGCDPPLDPTS